VHTIKGTCGFLGLARLERVAHAAENVLGKYRNGTFPVTPSSITLILRALDAIRSIVNLVEARLEPILRRRGLPSMGELSARLRPRADEDLACDIVDAMTTNETLFFRDARPFEHLRTQALPMLQASRPGRPLRIWSAASSSGQDSNSIALSVLDAPRGGRRVKILATDISGVQIAQARRGVYSDFEVSRGLAPDTLARHFIRGPDTWQISDAIRRMVEFHVWNLLDGAEPLGSFDVVFCRNLLFYLDVETKRRVLKTITEPLLPGGLLYLGGAETIYGVSDRFAPVPGTVQTYKAVQP
jgi:chemotaxis protein methyltransferase CheR